MLSIGPRLLHGSHPRSNLVYAGLLGRGKRHGTRKGKNAAGSVHSRGVVVHCVTGVPRGKSGRLAVVLRLYSATQAVIGVPTVGQNLRLVQQCGRLPAFPPVCTTFLVSPQRPRARRGAVWGGLRPQ